jgi:hypothetical protein
MGGVWPVEAGAGGCGLSARRGGVWPGLVCHNDFRLLTLNLPKPCERSAPRPLF